MKMLVVDTILGIKAFVSLVGSSVLVSPVKVIVLFALLSGETVKKSIDL